MTDHHGKSKRRSNLFLDIKELFVPTYFEFETRLSMKKSVGILRSGYERPSIWKFTNTIRLDKHDNSFYIRASVDRYRSAVIKGKLQQQSNGLTKVSGRVEFSILSSLLIFAALFLGIVSLFLSVFVLLNRHELYAAVAFFLLGLFCFSFIARILGRKDMVLDHIEELLFE